MTRIKANKAFEAMEKLGVSRRTVKPVLKKLLKVYDKNWEFIEAENYCALVDAIFEDKEENEAKRVDVNEMGSMNGDGSESVQKKLPRDREVEESSTVGSGWINKEDVPPTTSSGIPDTSNSSVEKRQVETGSCSAVQEGEGQSSIAMISAEKLISERGSSSSRSKFPLVGSSSLPINIDSIPVRGSTSKMRAVLPNMKIDSLTGNNISTKLPAWDHEYTKKSASACNLQRIEQRFDIVSLPTGDVKLCCVLELEKTTSHTPDADAVLNLVEEDFRRLHKIEGPPFSLKALLEDECKRLSELAIDSTYQSLVRTTSAVMISQDKVCTEDVAINNREAHNDRISEPESSQVLNNGRKKPPQLYIVDITNGKENVEISLVDERGSRQPPKFIYLRRNEVYQKAVVNNSLARIPDEDCCPDCSEDCLSSPVPCACVRVTNGEFGYTVDGLLKPEFLRACLSETKYFYCSLCPIEKAKNEEKPEKCKGHSVKKFIKECWNKCGCSIRCGNRVVQRGITRRLQVFWTYEGKGWGLRTLEDLPKGAFVCEYVGEIVTNTELDERNKNGTGKERHTYPVQLDADWNSESILDDDFALCLDATNFGNVARFINHKCDDANLIEVPVQLDSADYHYYHLAFFTTREVKAYEELTWDYELDFDDEEHPIKAFRCLCGTQFCRDTKNRKGTKKRSRASISIK